VFRFGGGEQTVDYRVDVLCGLNVQQFVVGDPEAVYPPSPFAPLADLQIDVMLPPSVPRGSTLHYVVALTNPTDHDISLDPCPSYIEDGIGAKEQHLLNCSVVQSIPAHGTVRFAMEMAIPDSANEGSGLMYWDFIGAGLDTHRVGHPIEVAAPASP
jgi:hypothetical protein